VHLIQHGRSDEKIKLTIFNMAVVNFVNRKPNLTRIVPQKKNKEKGPLSKVNLGKN
jgi:hypothetical protein